MSDKPSAPLTFKVRPKGGGFRTGIEPLKLRQLLDKLAVDDYQVKLLEIQGRRRPKKDPS